MAVSMRLRECPRNATSCVAKTKRRRCSFPSFLSSEKANWSNGSSKLCSADNSTLTARAFGSLAQHSGVFVLMGFNGLMTTTRKCEPAEMVRSPATEAQHVAMEAIPKANATPRRETASQFKRQRPVTGASHVLAQLLLVRREDANATPPTRNRHVPLLR